MIRSYPLGLGTRLRILLAKLDGELAELYKVEGHEFRPRFYPVFQLLSERDQASVLEIAEHLRVSQPAATQTLSEMRRLGLVTQKTGADRRGRLVALTPQAIEMTQALQPLWNAVARAASQLDEELACPLSDLLDEAIAALEEKSFPQRIAEQLKPGRP